MKGMVVTHWKNLKAFTVNPLEENKSFKSSSLTEELCDGEEKMLISKCAVINMWKSILQNLFKRYPACLNIV